MPSIRMTISVGPETYAKIAEMAKDQSRCWAAMARILLKESVKPYTPGRKIGDGRGSHGGS